MNKSLYARFNEWAFANPVMGHIVVWTVIVVIGVAFSFVSHRANETLPIRLDNCQPVDAWAKLSRAYDPLKFWVNVHSDLTRTSEDYLGPEEHRSDRLQVCAKVYHDQPSELAACIKDVTENYLQVVRCTERSAEMCRREGGRC